MSKTRFQVQHLVRRPQKRQNREHFVVTSLASILVPLLCLEQRVVVCTAERLTAVALRDGFGTGIEAKEGL